MPAVVARPSDTAGVGYAKYIGRVGALAVALGIGAAVATTPGIARATGDSDSSSPATDTATVPTGGDVTPGESPTPDPTPAGPTSAATPPSSTVSAQTMSPPSPPSPAGSTDTPDPRDGIVRASGGLNTTVKTSSKPTSADPAMSSGLPASAPSAAIAPVDPSTSPGNGRASGAGHRRSTVADPAPTPERVTRSALPGVIEAVHDPAVENVGPASAEEKFARTSSLAAAPIVNPSAVTPPPPANLLRFATDLVTTALAPFTGLGPTVPATPADTPVLWAVLAFVRRQFGRPQSDQRQAATTTAMSLATDEPVTETSSFTPMAAAAVTLAGTAPTAVKDSATTKEDTPVVINVKANDTDADGDALTTSVVTSPAHGAVSHNADGSFTYTPAANYHGTDTFTYRASDGTLNSAPATVTVTVATVNDAPVANPDTATTKEDTPVVINVVANDTDVENNPITPLVLIKPANGTVVGNHNGTYTYTPKANFTGTDTFTYRVSDGAATSAPVTVTVTVTAVNDAPTAVKDSATTKEDTPVVINVKANDTDADGDALTTSLVTSPAHGAVSHNADGSFTYTPAANYNGTDTFTYRVSDGAATSAAATVTVKVTAVNDAPVANPDTATTKANTRVVINVKANDTDVENNPLTSTVLTNPANGTVARNYDGTYTYTPKANFTGTDTFTYRVSDGAATSAPATVTVTVAPTNVAPIAGNDAATTAVNTPVVINVKANDTDADGDPLTTSLVTGPDPRRRHPRRRRIVHLHPHDQLHRHRHLHLPRIRWRRHQRPRHRHHHGHRGQRPTPGNDSVPRSTGHPQLVTGIDRHRRIVHHRGCLPVAGEPVAHPAGGRLAECLSLGQRCPLAGHTQFPHHGAERPD